jgi:hypothetical protein
MLMDKGYADAKLKFFMVWHNHLNHENRFVAGYTDNFSNSHVNQSTNEGATQVTTYQKKLATSLSPKSDHFHRKHERIWMGQGPVRYWSAIL